ncbi:hypothetical protein [Streptomyces mobaraensis]|uniref:Uncharacterized protein n=1 Tax=Streptomyces mobaraensis TaxID=35621 RepID=A0A5N5WCT7_STRMB|nr:hypothetical protein [Streptomyces mobaraensis]KAB7850156.1 hypothetical protein FRZ00_06040 [Streptomyces mobaraensis]
MSTSQGSMWLDRQAGDYMSRSNGPMYPSPAHTVAATVLRLLSEGHAVELPDGYTTDTLEAITWTTGHRLETVRLSERQGQELAQIARTLGTAHQPHLDGRERSAVLSVLRAVDPDAEPLDLFPVPERFAGEPISITGLDPGDVLASLFNHIPRPWGHKRDGAMHSQGGADLFRQIRRPWNDGWFIEEYRQRRLNVFFKGSQLYAKEYDRAHGRRMAATAVAYLRRYSSPPPMLPPEHGHTAITATVIATNAEPSEGQADPWLVLGPASSTLPVGDPPRTYATAAPAIPVNGRERQEWLTAYTTLLKAADAFDAASRCRDSRPAKYADAEGALRGAITVYQPIIQMIRERQRAVEKQHADRRTGR